MLKASGLFLFLLLMTINLFDDASWATLRPLTFTRPVADLRIGILTIAEKWAKHLHADFGFYTQTHLTAKFAPKANPNLFINGSICPNENLLNSISTLKTGEVLIKGEILIAFSNDEYLDAKKHLKPILFEGDFLKITYPEHIFLHNGSEIQNDYNLITKGRVSASLSHTNTFLGDNIFAEAGASADCSIFNSKQGPIYLGKNAQVWEGSTIRGSFALCEESSVKMGAKIYPNATIGPHCRVGGEINNAVIWGNSSKGHEGYLGNSVLGEWCNIGADSNNSNLKNNYADVKLWDYQSQVMRNTNLQFCGLIMADHAKCGINTMFNTGTVVGVGANVFGAGFPKNFIPDFSWGGAQGLEEYKLAKMLETTARVFARKEIKLDEIEQNLLQNVFALTKEYRRF